MSIAARDWAWAQEAKGITKLVLLALAERAGDDGHAWPSLNTLAKACGIPRSTVIRHIKLLQAAGLITERTPDHRENGANTSTHYRLAIEGTPLLHHATSPLVAERNKASSAVQQGLLHGDTTLVAQRNNKVNPLLKPKDEPSVEPVPSPSPAFLTVTTETPTRSRARGQQSRPDKKPPDPRTAVVFHVLEEAQGYKFSASAAAEMAAIRRMLDGGAEPDAIIACWKALKAQPFWRDKFLSLASVAKNLGEYQNGNMTGSGRNASDNGNGNHGLPRTPQPADGRGQGASSSLSQLARFG